MDRLACLAVVIGSLIAADASAQTNAVPAARPSLGEVVEVVVDGLHQGADVTLKAADAAIEGGKALGGEVDKATEGLVGKAGKVTNYAGHVWGAYKAYRDEGAEGMAIYGAQELGETVLDNMAEKLAGPAAPAWRIGRAAGNVIKQNVKVKGLTIEDHVTNFYFNNLHGRWANEEYERNTSDEAIERHRQKLRRAAQFSDKRQQNEQAAAALAGAQGARSDGEADVTGNVLLMLTPAIAAAAASRSRSPTWTPTQPPRADSCPPGQFQNWSDGKCYPWAAAGSGTASTAAPSPRSAPTGSQPGSGSSFGTNDCPGPARPGYGCR